MFLTTNYGRGYASRFLPFPQYGIPSYANLVRDAGGVLYLDARKVDGYVGGINSPFTNPFVDLTGKGNNATLTNFAGTTSDGYDNQIVRNSNGDVCQYSNLVTNGDFANGTTGWFNSGSTLSVASGSLNIIGDGSAVSPQAIQPISFTNGKRYYAKTKAKVTNANCTLIRIRNTNNTLGSVVNPVNGTDYVLSGIFTANSDTNINLIHTYADTATANGKILISDDVIAINLTDNPVVQAWEQTMGRQITVAECDRIFAFTATSNTVKASPRPFLTTDGINSYGTLSNTPSLDITGTEEFEIDAIVLTPSILSTESGIISKGLDTDSSQQYYLTILSDGRLYFILNGASYTLTSVGTIQPNTMYFIRVKRIGGRLTCTLNGIKTYDQANAVNITLSQPNCRVLAKSNVASGVSNFRFFKGSLAWLSIHRATYGDLSKVDYAIDKISKDYM